MFINGVVSYQFVSLRRLAADVLPLKIRRLVIDLNNNKYSVNYLEAQNEKLVISIYCHKLDCFATLWGVEKICALFTYVICIEISTTCNGFLLVERFTINKK